MCYNFNSKGVDLRKAMKDFEAEEIDTTEYTLGSINAFAKESKPTIPAIVNYNGIVLMPTFWGTIQNPGEPTKGKNLRSENSHTFYKKIEKNRCLIPASSYFESQAIFRPNKKDPTKQVRETKKFEMLWKDRSQFYIGAFYDIYADGNIGFGLVTTIPNPVQAVIHNRMIMTFDEKAGRDFLNLKPIEEFQFPNYSPNLEYINKEPNNTQASLF